MARGNWTAAEDAALVGVVDAAGFGGGGPDMKQNWAAVARAMPQRAPRECLDRCGGAACSALLARARF